MKINLGCGNKRLEGFLNVDKAPQCNPDQLLDLEQFPWDLKDDCADEILLEHVLEHVGRDVEVHRQIMQELHRVSKNGARITIVVPHPRSDSYLADPTHVRAIVAETFTLYSKTKCDEAARNGWATTPLAHYWDIDFEIDEVIHYLFPEWIEKLKRNEATEAEVDGAVRNLFNVVDQIKIELRTVKT